MANFSEHKIAPGDDNYVEKYNSLVTAMQSEVSNSGNALGDINIAVAKAKQYRDEAEHYKEAALGDSVSNTVRFTELNNPLVHLFAPNAIDKVLRGALTYTRSTSATYFDMYGNLRTAAIDEPRVNEKGLLIEGESTNYLYPSNGSSNTLLGLSMSTIIPVEWGGYECARLTESAANSQRRYRDTSPSPSDFVLGDVFTTSTYVQTYGDRDNIAVLIEFDGPNIVEFMLSDDSVGDIYTPNQSIIDAKIKRYKSGVCRLDITIEVTTAPAQNTVGVWLFFSDVYGNGNATYQGDEASYLDYYGSQVEKLPFATSYIPTDAAPVTRASDSASIEYYGNLSVETYTIAAEASLISLGGVAPNTVGRRHIYNLAGLNYNYMYIFENKLYASASYDDGTLTNTANAIGEAFSSNKCVTTRSPDGFAVYLNDGEGVSSPNPQPYPSNPTTTINIGRLTSTRHLWGYIKNFRIYDFALTEAERELL